MPVRLATTADADALVHVINRAYRVESHIFHGQRTDAADIHQRLRAPNVCFLVVDDDEAATKVPVVLIRMSKPLRSSVPSV